ncbi:MULTISPECIES: TadE/TadG family type IV pilus assembly protein [unclassified Ruegeria]|uniref:TadE/TadG family type IV pilus assembly protein n=1 Tax=unclassified Ruegeria TaxID=2625375 RepID=UPI00148840FC|nr:MULTISPECIES: TadE/TadG family type IV pilus assembly protein [unclassified Ruegeria]
MIKNAIVSGFGKFGKKSAPVRDFAEREDGTFTIFVLLGFLVIFATTGMGVDLMNYERDRANLQSTLDRAVLAAADLDQKLPPKEVVASYLEKAGLEGKLVGEPVVIEGLGSRTVSATAETVVKTHFMSFSGVNSLTARAASTAEESVGAVEISLVLDMSGSMDNPSAEAGKTKIEVLRDAAKEFVTLMLSKQDATEVSMSIVPYATQVNAGEDILSKFSNVTSEHSYSHCVNFSSTQFDDPSMDPTSAFQRTAHFDPFRYTNGAEQFPRYPVCPTRVGSEITAVTDDIDVLHNRIDALTAKGNTSIDVGMKWGSAMLDPKFKGIIKSLSTEGAVPVKFDDRPLRYEDDVLKVIIVMTDGKNTTQYMLNSNYRSGNSNVWFNPEYDRGDGKLGEYSVRYSTNPDRWVWMQHTDAAGYYVTATHPFGNPPDENASNEEVGTSVRLTYPELFNLASTWWNAKNNYYWQNNHESNWHYNIRSSVGATTKNTRTSNICGAAKDKGVIVYGIAFEAPDEGLTTIKNCASSDSHVYKVDEFDDPEGISLGDAFVSIASSIKKLRLTQ